jgi:hypothetical protein
LIWRTGDAEYREWGWTGELAAVRGLDGADERTAHDLVRHRLEQAIHL